MGREDRQDISKKLKAGSDIPARGKGVKDVNVNDKPNGLASIFKDGKPSGYVGRHRDKK